MSILLTIIHVIVCAVLIASVLLQSGKSADLAGAFGGVGSQAVFGPRGAATILSKATTLCAILFMITSLGLWIISARGDKSVVSREEGPAETTTETTTQEGQQESQTDEKQAVQDTEDQQEKQAEDKTGTEKDEK